jgi:hypothetical protein
MDIEEYIAKLDFEYEELFPVEPRKCLFDEEEDYASLLNYIKAQPHMTFRMDKLPFSSIDLPSFVEIFRDEELEKGKVEGRHLLFIKKSKKGEPDYCEAVGYYNKYKKLFFLLPYSRIAKDAYCTCDSYFKKKCGTDEIGKYTKVLHSFDSPDVAASCVLGQGANANEWHDSEGRRFSKIYGNFNAENKIASHVNAGSKQPSLFSFDTDKDLVLSNISEHLFFINKRFSSDRFCDAIGCYDEKTGGFVIKADSVLVSKVTPSFLYTASDIKRRRYIEGNCRRIIGSIEVIRDIVCDSPSQAAAFVVGRNADGWKEWVDKDGITLGEYIKA